MAASTAADSPAVIIPAQVGFLAIFNPSLGNTDETLDDQIVYYASVDTQTQKRKRHRKARPTENVSQAERNERLRQIGLAQGMVSFSKDFSDDQAVDSIETEKTRVVLHELEPGWWILASIDLTRLPLPPPKSAKKQGDAVGSAEEQYEHSSREVKPATLLLQDMLRAHSVFLLHHDSSLSSLFMRLKRAKFTATLSRYWDLFLSTWNVLLHGNPVQNIFGGIKIAASGELGIGVGEEERGSGEREVLEGFVERTEGLVDIIVSKFGDNKPEESPKSWERTKQGQQPSPQWLGATKEPGAEDGAVFLGVGSLSRNSVRDITHWVEDIYTWGEDAYGVLDSPKANRRSRRESRVSEERPRKSTSERPMQPPPSLINPKRRSKPAVASPPPQQRNAPAGSKASSETPSAAAEEETGGIEKYMDYLKLGYGKYWSLGGDSESKDGTKDSPSSPASQPSKGDDSVGHFLIGLTGEVEEGWVTDPEQRRLADRPWDGDSNPRTVLRTVTVELETNVSEKSETYMSKVLGSHDTELSSTDAATGTSFDNQDRNKTHKLRVVVYVIKPFIFTFLFELRTESLAFESLYRSLHHQISPLRKALGNSTAYRPEKPSAGSASAAIYDLVWDPKDKTVHSTIPNIPDAAEMYSSGDQPPWSRVEALNTHMQILNLYKATRADLSELERTGKTSRGWWIVWSRILERKPEASSSFEFDRASSKDSDSRDEESNEGTSDEATHSSSQTSTVKELPLMSVSKEIFLIRKASDHAGHGRSVSLTGVAAGGGWADGASRLAQGIGVDTRKYIEGLLSMNR
ncbi:vacuolar fusion protein ccz1 [Diaporthe amygdali]|uniref:vacuolar fusion protein ccz1 n=1 Tax=Phomopsis amygdali TaxID=1214568 RepID=UPI0022FE8F5A|nr:vacuolar fusion protein ccz1 [Diaporthe amygdali]KAJ0119342.1 vacuolar fusion protein ccz1 [Diaporthe amygdali]